MNRIAFGLLVILTGVSSLVLAQAGPATPAVPQPVAQSFEQFNAAAIRAHTWFLSTDLFEGRGPGTRGDELTTSFLAAQLEAIGLESAGDDGTYLQKISLLGITTDGERSKVAFTRKGAPARSLAYRDEFVGGDQTQNENVSFNSELIFVGHGVQAPEYRWDDYKGVDVKGKTLVMLVDDPPATAKEPDLFKGKARTYYGRWTYKFEMGTAKGAEAVILIHTDAAAGYGWQVVRNSWSGEQGYVKNPEGQHALKFAGWVTEKVAAELFAAAGHDLAALTRAAGSRNFKPVSLGTRFEGSLASTIRPFDTANVVAKLEGSDPKLKNEAVLYSAHHDHLGMVPAADGVTDTIYNGALDNASGTATVLELARVWSLANPRPRRSILFAFVAAEEQGLLGSRYLGENPPVPAGNIALGINIDMLRLLGEVTSVTMNGVERTTFLPAAERVTRAMNLTIIPDQAPEQGSYYRSDHFSFAKAGVPAFSISQGSEIVGKPAGWGAEWAREFREKHYHQPSDEFDPTWDFNAAVQVAKLAYWLGYEAAQADELPNWVAGDEFRAVRDESRKVSP
jgi:Zn-dependent M28 family amino/carboxypeptidase